MDILSPDEAREALANDNYCRRLGSALCRTYPYRKWYVEVVDKGRVAVVKIPDISMEFGVIIHLEQVIEPDIKKVCFAGGELLERFNLTRGKSDNHDLMDLDRNQNGVIGAREGELLQ